MNEIKPTSFTVVPELSSTTQKKGTEEIKEKSVQSVVQPVLSQKTDRVEKAGNRFKCIKDFFFNKSQSILYILVKCGIVELTNEETKELNLQMMQQEDIKVKLKSANNILQNINILNEKARKKQIDPQEYSVSFLKELGAANKELESLKKYKERVQELENAGNSTFEDLNWQITELEMNILILNGKVELSKAQEAVKEAEELIAMYAKLNNKINNLNKQIDDTNKELGKLLDNIK